MLSKIPKAMTVMVMEEHLQGATYPHLKVPPPVPTACPRRCSVGWRGHQNLEVTFKGSLEAVEGFLKARDAMQSPFGPHSASGEEAVDAGSPGSLVPMDPPTPQGHLYLWTPPHSTEHY